MPGDQRINIRATQEQKELLIRGAQQAGMSLTTFVLTVAEHAARKKLAEGQ